MKTLKEFIDEDMTSVGSVAGLTGEPPVHKKKKKDISVLRRFIADRNASNRIKEKRGMK
tara:strand:- start:268 stop:444 length:177 start_codon:yes stop_codon:yes gene_type:complete